MKMIERATRGGRDFRRILRSDIEALERRREQYEYRCQRFNAEPAPSTEQEQRRRRVDFLELESERAALEEQARTLKRAVALTEPRK